MPCPAGVNIPGNFKVWNTYHIYNNAAKLRTEWKNMPDKEKPGNCVKCGKCEAVCPQKIAIREDLEKVQKEVQA